MNANKKRNGVVKDPTRCGSMVGKGQPSPTSCVIASALRIGVNRNVCAWGRGLHPQASGTRSEQKERTSQGAHPTNPMALHNNQRARGDEADARLCCNQYLGVGFVGFWYVQTNNGHAARYGTTLLTRLVDRELTFLTQTASSPPTPSPPNDTFIQER